MKLELSTLYMAATLSGVFILFCLLRLVRGLPFRHMHLTYVSMGAFFIPAVLLIVFQMIGWTREASLLANGLGVAMAFTAAWASVYLTVRRRMFGHGPHPQLPR